MSKDREDKVMSIKVWIYVIGIVCLVAVSAKQCLHSNPVNNLWPPDMVPHPHIPDPKKGGDQASN
jgi:hypothetical protein